MYPVPTVLCHPMSLMFSRNVAVGINIPTGLWAYGRVGKPYLPTERRWANQEPYAHPTLLPERDGVCIPSPPFCATR